MIQPTASFARIKNQRILLCAIAWLLSAGPILADDNSTALKGKVAGADGKPASGVQIEAQTVGADGKLVSTKATTGANGSFSVALTKGQSYVIGVVNPDWAAVPQVVALAEDRPAEAIDFKLLAGTLLHGTVANSKQAGLPGETIVVRWQRDGRPSAENGPRFEFVRVTDANGKYSLRVAPGMYEIISPSKFKVPAYSNVGPQKEIIVDYYMENGLEYGELIGKIVGQDGNPAIGAKVEGHSVRRSRSSTFIRTTADAEGKWTAKRAFVPAVIGARSADGKFATVARLQADQSEITLQLAPAAQARGKLLDADGGPAANQQLNYGVQVPNDETDKNSPWVDAFGGTLTTDDQGNFTLTGLVPGQVYGIDISLGGGRSRQLATVEPTKAETVALADLKVPAPRREPTLDEKTATYFSTKKEFATVLSNAQRFAGPQALRVMLIVGDPKSDAARGFVNWREERSVGNSLFELLNDYEQLTVSTDDQLVMQVLKANHKLEAEALKPLSLVVLAADGSILGTKKLPLQSSPGLDAIGKEMRQFASAHALPRPDARELLAASLEQARREGKAVMLDESGTYCGWCRVLSRFFDRHPDTFEAHFVPLRIDRSRFAHGEEVMKQYRSTQGGIPWCAVLDADGKKLGDWDTADGNMGYPTLPKELDHLEKILKLAAPKITEKQLAEMRADLEREAKKYGQP